MTWLGKRPRSQLHLSWIKLEKRGVVLEQREYVALGQLERRACRVARIPVSTFRYEQTGTEDGVATADSGDGAGSGAMATARSMLLNREGWKVGKKLAYRLYREEGLTLRHKRCPGRLRPWVLCPPAPGTLCGAWANIEMLDNSSALTNAKTVPTCVAGSCPRAGRCNQEGSLGGVFQ